MYIVFTKDGRIYRRDHITGKILIDADEGKVQVVRVDGPIPMIYIQNVWEPVGKI